TSPDPARPVVTELHTRQVSRPKNVSPVQFGNTVPPSHRPHSAPPPHRPCAHRTDCARAVRCAHGLCRRDSWRGKPRGRTPTTRHRDGGGHTTPTASHATPRRPRATGGGGGYNPTVRGRTRRAAARVA